MGLNRKHKILWLLLLLMGSFNLHADDGFPYDNESDDALGEYYYAEEEYPEDKLIEQEHYRKPLEKREHNKSAWEKAREGINYKGGPDIENNKGKANETIADSTKRTESKEPIPPPKNLPFFFPEVLGKILLYLGIGVMILCAIALIYFIVKNISPSSGNTEVTNNLRPSEQLKDIEKDLNKSDLEKALEAALAANDYRTAIRIYYLMIVKELSNKQWIKWKQDKTNGEYLREMSLREEYHTFRELTINFEKVWYGDAIINEERFSSMRPSFDLFIQQIKRSK